MKSNYKEWIRKAESDLKAVTVLLNAYQSALKIKKFVADHFFK